MLCGLRPLLDYHQEWQARLQDRPRGHFHYLCAHRRSHRCADGRADNNIATTIVATATIAAAIATSCLAASCLAAAAAVTAASLAAYARPRH